MPEDLKTQFKVAVLKNRVSIQNLLEAFAEEFITFTNKNGSNDAKTQEIMKTIVRRAAALKGELV
jgi:hypothetical protein